MLHEDEIVAKLEERYEQSAALRSAWSSEADDLRQIVGEIAKAVSGQYELDEPLGIGGSGIVLRVHDVRLGVDRALKFSRPSPGSSRPSLGRDRQPLPR